MAGLPPQAPSSDARDLGEERPPIRPQRRGSFQAGCPQCRNSPAGHRPLCAGRGCGCRGPVPEWFYGDPCPQKKEAIPIGDKYSFPRSLIPNPVGPAKDAETKKTLPSLKTSDISLGPNGHRFRWSADLRLESSPHWGGIFVGPGTQKYNSPSSLFFSWETRPSGVAWTS